MIHHFLGGPLGQHPVLPTPQQAMSPYTGPKYDGMPAPPSPKEIIAALRKEPEVMLFLREIRVTEYHWVAERGEGQEPITGGHHDKFAEMREECEYLLDRVTYGPFANVRAVRIFDALGQLVWSKERPRPAAEPPAA